MHLGENHRAEVRRILKQHLPGGVEVYVFGSRAHGRNLKPYSDLDLCLQGGEAIPSAILSKLSADFENSLLPYRIDLVDWAVLSPEFRAAIGGDLERLGE